MTPACCNCVFFHNKDGECHNPDSTHYVGLEGHKETYLTDWCKHWEHFWEFEHEERRRLKHGAKR